MPAAAIKATPAPESPCFSVYPYSFQSQLINRVKWLLLRFITVNSRHCRPGRLYENRLCRQVIAYIGIQVAARAEITTCPF
jgi:hypothetical protein